MATAKSAQRASASIEAKALKSALRDVVGVVESRNTIPILSHVVLRVASDTMTIAGTDLDILVERRVALTAASPITCAVDASTLARVADKLPADSVVELTAAAGKLVVTAGRARFTLATLPVDDFPVIATPPGLAAFEIDALLLNGALGRVAHAISTEEVRYYLNGVFLHLRGDGRSLRLAATDGHRLAEVSLPAPEGVAGMPDVIVPRKTARILSSLLDRHEGSVEVSINERAMRFKVGATTLISKAIDGRFPDHTRVIPTANDAVLRIDRAGLEQAVARVVTVSSDKTRAIKLTLSRDIVTLSVSSPEHGTGVEELPCDYRSADLSVGFNARYLLDTLAQLTAETVEAWFADAAAPSLWRDGEDSPALFVLMPMRV